MSQDIGESLTAAQTADRFEPVESAQVVPDKNALLRRALQDAEAGLVFAGADVEPAGDFVPTPTLALRAVRAALAAEPVRPQETAALPPGFDRASLMDLADWLAEHDKTINPTPPRAGTMTSLAYAEAFIRAALAVKPQGPEAPRCMECGGRIQWRCPACNIASSIEVSDALKQQEKQGEPPHHHRLIVPTMSPSLEREGRELIGQWEDARAATQAEPVPGMVLVPREPTPEMLRAAFNLFELPDIDGYATGNDARRGMYLAMITAAPKAVKPSPAQGGAT